jgi:hypothetical protein
MVKKTAPKNAKMFAAIQNLTAFTWWTAETWSDRPAGLNRVFQATVVRANPRTQSTPSAKGQAGDFSFVAVFMVSMPLL